MRNLKIEYAHFYERDASGLVQFRLKGGDTLWSVGVGPRNKIGTVYRWNEQTKVWEREESCLFDIINQTVPGNPQVVWTSNLDWLRDVRIWFEGYSDGIVAGELAGRGLCPK